MHHQSGSRASRAGGGTKVGKRIRHPNPWGIEGKGPEGEMRKGKGGTQGGEEEEEEEPEGGAQEEEGAREEEGEGEEREGGERRKREGREGIPPHQPAGATSRGSRGRSEQRDNQTGATPGGGESDIPGTPHLGSVRPGVDSPPASDSSLIEAGRGCNVALSEEPFQNGQSAGVECQ